MAHYLGGLLAPPLVTARNFGLTRAQHAEDCRRPAAARADAPPWLQTQGPCASRLGASGVQSEPV